MVTRKQLCRTVSYFCFFPLGLLAVAALSGVHTILSLVQAGATSLLYKLKLNDDWVDLGHLSFSEPVSMSRMEEHHD
jgi:hypothetical protein